jgi:hypothetical protein
LMAVVSCRCLAMGVDMCDVAEKKGYSAIILPSKVRIFFAANMSGWLCRQLTDGASNPALHVACLSPMTLHALIVRPFAIDCISLSQRASPHLVHVSLSFLWRVKRHARRIQCKAYLFSPTSLLLMS